MQPWDSRVSSSWIEPGSALEGFAAMDCFTNNQWMYFTGADTKMGEYMREKCGGGPGRIPVWEEVVCKWKVMCFILPKMSNREAV